MSFAIEIPTTGGYTVHEYTKETGPLPLAGLQAMVGGYIEPLPVNTGKYRVEFYADEEGKLKGYDVNALASALIDKLNAYAKHLGITPVVGTIVAETRSRKAVEYLTGLLDEL